uniref:Uncharacterized protein AlNc14C24G2439 n=1 Tax=Albugo laibachii Nc14 TaxID=890382 RepID=F0W6D9_9STRA|nr:conserved hypothetical protein [Albugo laibachii Nc14]|eukprot:CCA16683.1 conserved hypothetical protein [Albugo laibachii Nc14]
MSPSTHSQERATCTVCKRLDFSLGPTCGDCKHIKKEHEDRYGDKQHECHHHATKVSAFSTEKAVSHARLLGCNSIMKSLRKSRHSGLTWDRHRLAHKSSDIIDLLSSEDEAQTEDCVVAEAGAFSDSTFCALITTESIGITPELNRTKVDERKEGERIRPLKYALDRIGGLVDSPDSPLPQLVSVEDSNPKDVLEDFRLERYSNTLESHVPDMEVCQSKRLSDQSKNIEDTNVALRVQSRNVSIPNEMQNQNKDGLPKLVRSRIFDTIVYDDADFPCSSKSKKVLSNTYRKLTRLQSMPGLCSPETYLVQIQRAEADKKQAHEFERKHIDPLSEQIPQYGLTIDLTYLSDVDDVADADEEIDDTDFNLKPGAILKEEMGLSGPISTIGKTHGLSPTAFCVLCEHRRSKRGMIRCPVCTKFYHKHCARAYGDEKICWNCELDDMIDDSELTESGRSLVVDMIQTLRSSPLSTESTSKPAESGQPFVGNESKSMERWKHFLEESTVQFDASFHEITAKITDELKSENRNEQYSHGFTDPKDFQNQICAVLDKYASKQDEQEKEAKERQCQRAVAFPVPAESIIEPQEPTALMSSLIETVSESYSTFVAIDDNELLRSSPTINFRNVKV